MYCSDEANTLTSTDEVVRIKTWCVSSLDKAEVFSLTKSRKYLCQNHRMQIANKVRIQFCLQRSDVFLLSNLYPHFVDSGPRYKKSRWVRVSTAPET